ncbi:MAG: addiction module protein [Chitinophagaceae bacterium]|jgi:hypothetical protein|nr:addiction module protein [Chitinophagaceae bacterium]
MNTATIKKRPHTYLENADDKKLKAIYTMVEHDVVKDSIEYTGLFKTELKKRVAAYKKNPATAISAAESKKRIHNLLNKVK